MPAHRRLGLRSPRVERLPARDGADVVGRVAWKQ